jgi:hypothetical protein
VAISENARKHVAAIIVAKMGAPKETIRAGHADGDGDQESNDPDPGLVASMAALAKAHRTEDHTAGAHAFKEALQNAGVKFHDDPREEKTEGGSLKSEHRQKF